MESFSPVTRKILAIGLLVLALLIAVQLVLVPLAGAIAEQRAELADLRGRAAHLSAVLDTALPPMSQLPAHAIIKAGARDAAVARFEGAINQASAAAGVNLQQQAAMPSGINADQLIRLRVAATGSEEALLRFAAILEHGEPLARFQSWHIQTGTGPDRTLVLTSQIVAAWERRQ